MPDNSTQIGLLLQKLDAFAQKQQDLSSEIDLLRVEISLLRSAPEIAESDRKVPVLERAVTPSGFQRMEGGEKSENIPIASPIPWTNPKKTIPVFDKLPAKKSDLEKFIGENLISKIGIAITVIGVFIGAKYAIDNGLISPLTRIVLGYLAGAGLLGFALKLKQQYENFSAVLLSGAMAIFYFITFSAYSFYQLIPPVAAFLIMVITTIFTVLAALHYNKQIIALYGMVGAYAVPFLLSDGSGKVAILFTYMAIINSGILFIAFKKYWKLLYYVAFGLTWLIFGLWYMANYNTKEHFGLATAFLFIFFSIFYLAFLAYKLVQKEKFDMQDILLLLLNSFIFYALGYAIFDGHRIGAQLLGVFTLINAALHLVVAIAIYRQKAADRNLFYLVAGLALVFITMAIPVQLNGQWVTLLWAGEAALLFWIGRTKSVDFYERLSYPLMLLAFFSLLQDWALVYGIYSPGIPDTRLTPLLNINFLGSVLFISAFVFIWIFHQNRNYVPAELPGKRLSKNIGFFVPAILLFTIYAAFRLEIENYWDQLFMDADFKYSNRELPYANYGYVNDLLKFGSIWVINYSLLFSIILTVVNIKKWKNSQLAWINLTFMVLSLLGFFLQGLYLLGELRESYIEKAILNDFKRDLYFIKLRYISFGFVAVSLFACYKYVWSDFIQKNFKKAFDLLLYTSILWIASSELIHWLDLGNSSQSYKLGLSILWGVYALLLISLGIRKRKKTLRIGAIALFSVTLIKLFVYDISNLDTIAKTIVFVSLGVLLLIISFLYNKYKHIISEEVIS